MAEAGPGEAGGYVAFISYSHRDVKVGRWLHRKLEGYRLPKRLAGTQGEDGEVPERLTPIFRDRDELPAAGDLSERVRAALAVSRNLIVLCSPHSAASPWVAKEIATFRELHPNRPIFTAIVEGEPDRCFSPALLEGGVEPLAADLRKKGDGRRLGLLKLVAGLAGVGLDALVQRDASRRVRRVTYVTAAAVAAMLAMALLTAFALNARAEAQRQRAEAEGLVEFMLTDLRRELKGVGSLKVLTAANQRALHYYQGQDLAGLSAESLERRARILHAIGEDDMSQDKLDRALSRFQEAAATTGRLLVEKPRDPERIYAHAQSEFWIGHVDYRRNNLARARSAFERYKKLAEALIASEPASPRGRIELAYAEGNICTVALEQAREPNFAIQTCAAALAYMKQATAHSRDPEMISAVANRYAWLADAYRAAGDETHAWLLRVQQETLLKDLLARDQDSFRFREAWLTNQFSMAELEAARGQRKKAMERLQRSLTMVEDMTRTDPSNFNWQSRKERIEADLGALRGKGK